MFLSTRTTVCCTLTGGLWLSLLTTPLQALTLAPVIVISPSQVAQPIRQVGSSVIFFDADELRDRGIEFVEDALQEIPSLIVSSQGARGSQVQVRMRGNEANHVLVLVDGMRVSNASTGEFDLSTLSLAAIDNIEVLKGPQSTIYGSDAIAGVINITTIKGSEGLSGHISAGLGERGIRSTSAAVKGASERWHYSVTLEDFTTDGISLAASRNGNVEKDAYDKQALNFKGGVSAESFSSTFILGRTDSDLDFDTDDFNTGLAIDESVNNQQIESQHIAWQLDIPSTDERFDNRFQLSKVDNDYDIQTVFFGDDSTFRTFTERTTLEYRGSANIDEINSIQYGLEQVSESLITENISSSGTSRFDEEVDTSDQYVNLLVHRPTMDISAGMRSSKHDQFGSHHTYRITGSFQLNNHFRLLGAHGTGYKAPNLQELFDTSFGGNANLQPEESVSTELGMEYATPGYLVNLTYFNQDTDDLIRYVGSFPTGVNQNVGEASSEGVELNLRKNWSRVELTTALSKTRATETVNGVTSKRLRVPEWSANVLASYRYAQGRVWLKALYRDERRDTNFATASDVILDSYTLWSLGTNYKLRKDLTLSARVENVSDEDYEEVFSYGTRGRTAIVSAKWVF